MSIGTRLKKIRIERGLSQKDLGKIANIHPFMISKYETDRVIPSADKIIAFVNALKISADQLLFDNNRKGNNGSNGEGLKNLKLLEKIKLIDKMSPKDQEMIIRLIDAMIVKNEVEEVIKPRLEER